MYAIILIQNTLKSIEHLYHTYAVSTERRKGALLRKTTHQGIVCGWWGTSPIRWPTCVINEERLNIRIRPRIFAQLVLPVETANKNIST
jgi:hypothetical protein